MEQNKNSHVENFVDVNCNLHFPIGNASTMGLARKTEGRLSKRYSDSTYQTYLFLVAFASFANVAFIYNAHLALGSTSSHSGPRSDYLERPVFATCLLTKDDLGILPEWIAYHYHAVELRHLVVAVDPSSKTNPSPLFDKFRSLLPTLRIDQWSDNNFMPQFFLNGTFGRVPNFMGVELHDKETFEQWHTSRHVGPVKVRDMTKVNNHRYRQTRFISQCAQHLTKTHAAKRVLLSLLDTDEYLVVNPLIVRKRFTSNLELTTSWERCRSGSVLQWLIDSHNMSGTSPCIQVPRLLFGSVETNATDDVTASLVETSRATGPNSTTPSIQLLSNIRRSFTKLETLRWKYHAAWNDTRNFQQKVILDLQRIPSDDELWGDHINSVHRPSRQYCPPESDRGESFATSAVAAFHFLGSLERYFARPNDLRRNQKRYRERSNLTFAREPGWIDQWLESFVKNVGLETAAALLVPYILHSL